MPLIDSILKTLRHASYLFSVDLKQAFFQIPLKDSFRPAFAVYGKDLCEIRVMPFGLSNSPVKSRSAKQQLWLIEQCAMFVSEIKMDSTYYRHCIVPQCKLFYFIITVELCTLEKDDYLCSKSKYPLPFQSHCLLYSDSIMDSHGFSETVTNYYL